MLCANTSKFASPVLEKAKKGERPPRGVPGRLGCSRFVLNSCAGVKGGKPSRQTWLKKVLDTQNAADLIEGQLTAVHATRRKLEAELKKKKALIRTGLFKLAKSNGFVNPVLDSEELQTEADPSSGDEQ